jgi:membrane protein implicated in regulation of membrane protease activity
VSAMAAGAIVLAGGLFALIAAAVLALAPIWPDWLAALVVGAVVSAVGAILLAIGRRSTVERGLKPRRTLASLGEARELAREQKERAARSWR